MVDDSEKYITYFTAAIHFDFIIDIQSLCTPVQNVAVMLSLEGLFWFMLFTDVFDEIEVAVVFLANIVNAMLTDYNYVVSLVFCDKQTKNVELLAKPINDDNYNR